MKVLMFGWEFPPNISGGLGTACYGITKSLSTFDDVDITFVIPKAHGNEPQKNLSLLGANQIDLIKSKIRQEKFRFPKKSISVESSLVPYPNPSSYCIEKTESVEKTKEHKIGNLKKNIRFSGNYGPDLLTEIHNYSIIGGYIASQDDFDIIHAHDWLTFPAGIAAKKVTGKPLVVHVHATDFDRSGGKTNPEVYKIEKEGLKYADCILTVSNHTRQMVIKQYQVSSHKIHIVHNGVEPFKTNNQNFRKKNSEKIVTFLGRITVQKGPAFFVQVAKTILEKIQNVRFVMAGNGDLMPEIISQVAKARIADRFHFTGFLKENEVLQLLNQSDIYMMPSVSEPFGISPLEAMQCNVPSIISYQSGVSEVVKHVIKTDFWDINAMSDAIYSILKRPALNKMLSLNGKSEVKGLKWLNSADKIYHIYQHLSA